MTQCEGGIRNLYGASVVRIATFEYRAKKLSRSWFCILTMVCVLSKVRKSRIFSRYTRYKRLYKIEYGKFEIYG